jgi:hypothetical protein
VLETVKIRSPGLVQGYHLAIDNSVVGKITERLSDLRESFVEVLVVARVQNSFAVGSDADGAVAVQLNFVTPIRSFRKVRNQSAFHWFDEVGFSLW